MASHSVPFPSAGRKYWSWVSWSVSTSVMTCSIRTNFSDQLVDLVGDRFDLAIRMRSPGEGSGLVSICIAQEETIVCASPNSLAKRGALISDIHLVWMRSLHMPPRIRAAIDAFVAGTPGLIET